MKLHHNLLQVAIWLDQGLNVLLGGYADETLSARAHRMREKKHKYWGWAAKAIDALFFWEKDHCLQAHQSEVLRRQLPTIYQPAQPGHRPSDS